MQDKTGKTEETFHLQPGGKDRFRDTTIADEVPTGPTHPQPRWLLLLSAALYAFAILYMLAYAGERWIIRIFALALAGWAGYSCRGIFASRGTPPEPSRR